MAGKKRRGDSKSSYSGTWKPELELEEEPSTPTPELNQSCTGV